MPDEQSHLFRPEAEPPKPQIAFPVGLMLHKVAPEVFDSYAAS